MKVADLQQLADLVARERKSLLDAWRAQVRQLPSAAHMDTPTLNDHIPALIDELIVALRRVSDQTIAEAMLQGSPPDHGLQRQQEGFDIVEVVAADKPGIEFRAIGPTGEEVCFDNLRVWELE